MCKRFFGYIKKIAKEIIRPENIAKYVIFFLLGLAITAIFQYSITPHPKIKVTFDPDAGDMYRVRVRNTGDKATEDLQFRILYNEKCYFASDPIETNFFNDTLKDFSGPYNEPPYSMKWIIDGFELNPGVEFSVLCLKSKPFQIRISGSNFAEVVKSNKV